MKTKKILLPALAIIALPTLMLQSCKDKHIETRTFTANVPIYKSYDQMRTEVGSKETQPLKNPGKIYVFGSYILVNEFHKGIHVINNQDPYNPQNIGFLNIPGNVDISVKGNILYADSYTDLVAIDISDPKNIKETKRVKDVLQYSVPKYDERYPLAKIDETRGVIAGWEIKEVTETCLNKECGSFRFNENGMLVSETQNGGFGATQGGNARNATVEVGGSMSRFAIKEDCLYVISSVSDLKVFDISNTSSPSVSSAVMVSSWNTIETTFVYEDHLFIGAQNGMFIYDISSCTPEYVSQFEHAEACDPVVVYDNYAYVSLNSQGPCGGWQNQVDVVDISDISNPNWTTTIQMDHPKGLSIDPNNNVLFVCDGESGLKMYDISNVDNSSWSYLSQVSGVDAYDAILLFDRLMLIGDDGLYQYTYTDVDNITQISVIPIEG